MSQPKPDQLRADVAKTLKRHVATELVRNDHIEAWRFAQPGSSAYAFDIAITRFGIAVFGDIDALTFKVGASYGLAFLAGNDIDYYVHSKLEHHNRVDVLDTDAWTAEFEKILGRALGHEIDDDVTATIAQGGRPFTFRVVAETSKPLRDRDDSRDDWYELGDAIDGAQGCTTVHEVYAFLQQHREVLEFNDFGDVGNITMTDPMLRWRLYALNHAAKTILTIKKGKQ